MVQGIGTITGAMTVLIAALMGRSTFKDWKVQKIEERRMNVAESVLTLGYRLTDALIEARSRITPEQERDAAAAQIDEASSPGGIRTGTERENCITAQVIINRLAHFRSDWDEIWTLKPLVLAYFGAEVQETIGVFWTLRATLVMLAQQLGDEAGNDRDRAVQIRRELFASDDDSIGMAMDEALKQLEANLLPKLRSAVGNS